MRTKTKRTTGEETDRPDVPVSVHRGEDSQHAQNVAQAKPNTRRRKEVRRRTVGGGANVTPVRQRTFAEAIETFRRWLELPDPGVLAFVFGAVLGNRYGDDPVWGGIVGASGDTKTEILRSLKDPKLFYTLSNLTSKTLISGLPSRVTGGREPSLLPELDGKILVVKDLTPLITGPRETRAMILGILRDAYDGYSEMAFGTGEVKRFKSRFGFLFGVTPVIELCWPVINQLGERFIYYQCPESDSLLKVQAALDNSNQKAKMRKELESAAQRVLDQADSNIVEVDGEAKTQIAHLADFVARARTPVRREGRTEEVAYQPSPEVGTRLGGQFFQLACGITSAKGSQLSDETTMSVVRHVARSGIPRLRLRLMKRLQKLSDRAKTAELGRRLRLGSSSVKRTLEDLWLLKLVERSGTERTGYEWRLSALGRERLNVSRLLSSEGATTPP